MCGIVFIKTNNKLPKKVMRMYRAQEKRGTEGYGYVGIKDGVVGNVKRFSTIETTEKEIKSEVAESILFHHRKPTSTPNIPECNHPITVSNDKLQHDYVVVHNGVISNALKLRDEFETMGFVYTTAVEKLYRPKSGTKAYITDEQFNDSESLAIDLSLAIEGNLDKIKSEGSIAFVVIQKDKVSGKALNIFFGRNYQNPLKMNSNNGMFSLASEGDGQDVVAHTLHKMNPTTLEIEKSNMSFGYIYNNDYKTNQYKTVDIKKDTGDTVSKELAERTNYAEPSVVWSYLNRQYYDTKESKLVDYKFTFLNDKLYRTQIPKSYFYQIHNAEIITYIELTKKIEDLLEYKMTNSDKMTELEKQDVSNELRFAFVEMRAKINDVVTKRLTAKVI